AERGCGHREAEEARSNRMPLGVVGVEETLGRRPADDLRELPSQVHRILDTDVEPLSACGGMHVSSVAGEEHAAIAIGRRLSCHVRKSRYPSCIANAVIRSVYVDERALDVLERRLVVAYPRLDQHDARALSVLQLRDRVDTSVTTADAPRGLGDDVEL